MKNGMSFLIGLLIFWVSSSGFAAPDFDSFELIGGEESLPSERSNDVLSLELGGRGILYSINYDRQVTEQIRFGLGLSYFTPVEGFPQYLDQKVFILPIYGNYYVTQMETHHFFITGGINLTFSQSRLPGFEGKDQVLVPLMGAGYEYRQSKGGIVLRAAPYIAFASKKMVLNGGLSIGHAF